MKKWTKLSFETNLSPPFSTSIPYNPATQQPSNMSQNQNFSEILPQVRDICTLASLTDTYFKVNRRWLNSASMFDLVVALKIKLTLEKIPIEFTNRTERDNAVNALWRHVTVENPPTLDECFRKETENLNGDGDLNIGEDTKLDLLLMCLTQRAYSDDATAPAPLFAQYFGSDQDRVDISPLKFNLFLCRPENEGYYTDFKFVISPSLDEVTLLQIATRLRTLFQSASKYIEGHTLITREDSQLLAVFNEFIRDIDNLEKAETNALN